MCKFWNIVAKKGTFPVRVIFRTNSSVLRTVWQRPENVTNSFSATFLAQLQRIYVGWVNVGPRGEVILVHVSSFFDSGFPRAVFSTKPTRVRDLGLQLNGWTAVEKRRCWSSAKFTFLLGTCQYWHQSRHLHIGIQVITHIFLYIYEWRIHFFQDDVYWKAFAVIFKCRRWWSWTKIIGFASSLTVWHEEEEALNNRKEEDWLQWKNGATRTRDTEKYDLSLWFKLYLLHFQQITPSCSLNKVHYEKKLPYSTYFLL